MYHFLEANKIVCWKVRAIQMKLLSTKQFSANSHEINSERRGGGCRTSITIGMAMRVMQFLLHIKHNSGDATPSNSQLPLSLSLAPPLSPRLTLSEPGVTFSVEAHQI